MRFEYLLYPKTIKKLESSGIKKRIEDNLEDCKGKLPFNGVAVCDRQIRDSVKELEQDGVYKNLSSEFFQKYKEIMNEMLHQPNNFSWSIKKLNETNKEPCELTDMRLFSGEIASLVLKPRELWDYSKFNFSSPLELVTAVGVSISQQVKSSSSVRGSYKWEGKRFDGANVVNQITGDFRGDLEICQRDVTPYKTKDPFGNEINVRPITTFDKKIIAASHSNESMLFVAVMQYIQQRKIKVNYQKDNAKELIQKGRYWSQDKKYYNEHHGEKPGYIFGMNGCPIPVLNKLNETKRKTPFSLEAESNEGKYNVYIADNGDLVLSYQDDTKEQGFKKPISIRFNQNDAEHLITGLILQSAKGIGRTPVEQLLNILEHKTSSKVLKNKKCFIKQF
jgi:hypothetical protein